MPVTSAQYDQRSILNTGAYKQKSQQAIYLDEPATSSNVYDQPITQKDLHQSSQKIQMADLMYSREQFPSHEMYK